MIEEKVVKKVCRADIQKINCAHEYVLNMKNVTAKRCYVAREMFNAVLGSITTQEEECVEERLETEEEAKAILGRDFVERLEAAITYCTKNQLLLFFHGTNEENISPILNEGLKCHTNDLLHTSLGLSEDNLYANLLNWPHRRYKGIIMLAIPKHCLDVYCKGVLPIWNGKDGGAYVTGYELSPEFILGGLDIRRKAIIMNDAFSCEHDYSKFRLRNQEVDDLVVTHDEEVEEELASTDWNDEVEDDSNMTGETKTEDSTTTPSVPSSNPKIRALMEEKRVSTSSVWTPRTEDAIDAIERMCEILAFWRSEMELLRSFAQL